MQRTHYALLHPADIDNLNVENPPASVSSFFSMLLRDALGRCDVLILSHEYLFQCPRAIQHLCNLARPLVAHITIVGYSRRQSDFVMSAYSQWHFRMPERVTEAREVFARFQLDHQLFSGLEQFIITSIEQDFYGPAYVDRDTCRILDWYACYHLISRFTSASGAVVKCGVLPRKGSDNNLLQDFCNKAALTLRPDMQQAAWKIVNMQFHQDLVEAVNNAVAMGMVMPGPHAHNDTLDRVSALLGDAVPVTSELVRSMLPHIDTCFEDSNRRLCQAFGMAESYFAPTVRLGKREVQDMIRVENQRRASDKSSLIQTYRLLSARMIDLCLKLAMP